MRQELFHHANRPAQIDFNLSSDFFEASGFVVNIDLTHDACVVDQNIELWKLSGDLLVKSGDRFRIGDVALKGVNFWKGGFRTVHLSLIAARDKNLITKCRELFGEFVTDAAGAAGDQNRIALEFHDKILPKLRDHLKFVPHVDQTLQVIERIRISPLRPPAVRLQERTLWQALYQASPPPSSAQGKRARGRSRYGS